MNQAATTMIAILFSAIISFSGGNSRRSKMRTFRGEIWDSLCAVRGTHRKVEKMYNLPNDRQQCLLKCIERLGGKYVLYTPRTGDTYELDDQQEPKRYAGQKVKATGTYDKSTNTIHLREIVAGPRTRPQVVCTS